MWHTADEEEQEARAKEKSMRYKQGKSSVGERFTGRLAVGRFRVLIGAFLMLTGVLIMCLT